MLRDGESNDFEPLVRTVPRRTLTSLRWPPSVPIYGINLNIDRNALSFLDDLGDPASGRWGRSAQFSRN
jgi:hypothetical protein